jgi:hypothetical protein
MWGSAATSHVLSLTELGQHEAAVEHADRYVSAALAELEHVPDPLQLARALARARAGRNDAADLADSVIHGLLAREIGGLHLGVAYECRARIAMHMEDTNAFARYADLCRSIFGKHRNSALTAKYHRLLQGGRHRFAGTPTGLTGTPGSAANYNISRLELALGSCRDLEQRARFALTLLTRQSGAIGGCLFLLTPEGPSCKGQVGDPFDPKELLAQVCDYMAQHSQRSATASSTHTGDFKPEALVWSDSGGRRFKPIPLSHSERGTFLMTGLGALTLPEAGGISIPAETVAAISRFYAGTGATSLMLLTD